MLAEAAPYEHAEPSMDVDQANDIVAQRPTSVGAVLLEQVKASGDREAFRHLRDGRWVSLSWTETKDAAFELAAGLLALGIQLEDRVAIASGTRIEWVLADLAIMSAGAATTTVYPTTQHDDVAFILGDSGSRVVFAEDQGQVDKIEAHADELPDLETIVQISGAPRGPRTISLDDLRARGRERLAVDPSCVEDVIAQTGPDHLATLIYTSGTTGRPKGVRLVHDCWTYDGAAVEAFEIIYRDDLQYLWLPLSHVFGKCLIAVQLKIGFATRDRGRHRLPGGEPRRRAADLHVRGAAHLREGPVAGHDERVLGPAQADRRLGVRGGAQDRPAPARGQAAARPARGAAGPGRPARLLRDQGPDGRQDQVLHVGVGRPQPRGPGVVLRRRAARCSRATA